MTTLPQSDLDICLMLSRVLGDGVTEDENVANAMFQVVRLRRGTKRAPVIGWRDYRGGTKHARRQTRRST